mgnify:CR=1 FL=1
MNLKWFEGSLILLFLTILPLVLVSADTFHCNSCDTCNQMIKDAKPGDTVVLENDITTTGDCINIDKNGVTFDCQGHSISDSDSGTGIRVNAENVKVKNCEVKRFDYGIDVKASNSVLEGNRVRDNTITGIRLIDSHGHNLTGNVVEDNFLFGILVYNVTNSSFVNNTVTGSLESGISITNSRNNTLENNTVTGNKVRGIYLRNSTGNVIKNNNISNNQVDGIGLEEGSSGNKIINNTMRFNGNKDINPLDKSSEDNEIEYLVFGEYLERFKEVFDHLLETPVLPTVFRNERINFYVDGNPEGYVVIENSRVVAFGEDELTDQTMNVFVRGDVINEILEGETTVEEALERGEIRYEGVGLINSLKVRMYAFFFDIYSFVTSFSE